MNNLIKVFDSAKAEQLINVGFEYMLESINGQPVYAFCITEELLSYLKNNFAQNDFIVENILRF